MEGNLFYGVMALVVLAQVLLTVLIKKRWVKWIPAMLLGLLTALCMVFYGLTGWTNWGYLVLLAMLVVLLAADGVAAVFGCLIRRLIPKK